MLKHKRIDDDCIRVNMLGARTLVFVTFCLLLFCVINIFVSTSCVNVFIHLSKKSSFSRVQTYTICYILCKTKIECKFQTKFLQLTGQLWFQKSCWKLSNLDLEQVTENLWKRRKLETQNMEGMWFLSFNRVCNHSAFRHFL